MKKVIPLLVLLLLSACQMKNADLSFVGEGENWLAEVTVLQMNGEETYQIEITAKGSNEEDIDSFSYHVESINNGVIEFGANDVTLNQEGVYHGKSLSSNSPSTRGDDELEIQVEWNGMSESFELGSK